MRRSVCARVARDALVVLESERVLDHTIRAIVGRPHEAAEKREGRHAEDGRGCPGEARRPDPPERERCEEAERREGAPKKQRPAKGRLGHFPCPPGAPNQAKPSV